MLILRLTCLPIMDFVQTVMELLQIVAGQEHHLQFGTMISARKRHLLNDYGEQTVDYRDDFEIDRRFVLVGVAADNVDLKGVFFI